jgi:hypothetical protein
MSKTRLSIPLNDSALSTLLVGVKVSREPPGVDVVVFLSFWFVGTSGGGRVCNIPATPDLAIVTSDSYLGS